MAEPGALKVSMSSGDFHGAMRQDPIDKQNIVLYWVQDRHFFDVVMMPAVKLAFGADLFSKDQALESQVDCFGCRSYHQPLTLLSI